ncbi:uncharacterized protein LOC113512133 [Galleria mellonella]|uniref:Uncharacterized protein LOC113512133 n=1 Tax=Galleria mellonella TaxID=7137 RepID=A0A6J1WDP4_GALME|nr:uncharacterized protein LOC113512133 [Galleria mellonella]
MSKRFNFPQQHGERKKAKLDITISDHNFPLSQNSPIKKDNNQESWGDDNDDEILLLASQACEQVYSNDTSSLPDYSMCMQPKSTSTQNCDQLPSTSKSAFKFKTPSACIHNAVSTHLRNKCNTISSPLPGISSKITSKVNEYENSSEDIFDYKVYKGQDSDHLYRQLFQLQEENAKLKSENGKLLEKCVTKEGEASILRTQLKTCQIAVDNARLEKVKAQEKIQADWTEKLSSANVQIHDLRTELDFKNLEIISIKEKCKKLENNKVRLTQVTVGNNDIFTSHKNNNNTTLMNDTFSQQMKRAKMISNSVQTDNKAHFLKLYKSCKKEISRLNDILPLILETSMEQQFNILDYNEKLQRQTDFSQNKCRIFSTFHRLPSTPISGRVINKNKVSMSSIYEDLTCIATDNMENFTEKYFNIFKTVKVVLSEIETELATISRRMTTAFQKEMDEKYIESTSSYLCVEYKDLLQARNLYKEEQGVLARRMTATLVSILQSPKGADILRSFEQNNGNEKQFIDIISRICNLLDGTSCAVLYSGLLLSITMFIENSKCDNKILDILKSIIASRPMPFVACQILAVLRNVVHIGNFPHAYCPGGSGGNLRLDYDQGVLLYKKDSCYLQVLLKQIEACLKCMEKQNLIQQTVRTTQYLVGIYSSLNGQNIVEVPEKSRCDCQLVLLQVLVYGLRICAVMLKDNESNVSNTVNQELTAVCRCGLQVLYQCTLRDVEFASQLSYNEGHLIDFCEILKEYDHSEIHGNMLSELAGMFQSSPEDMPSSFHRQAWLNSFKNFSLAD